MERAKVTICAVQSAANGIGRTNMPEALIDVLFWVVVFAVIAFVLKRQKAKRDAAKDKQE